MRSSRRRPRHLARRRTTRRPPGRRGDRSLARLVICAVIFVALVAVKLLFPQAALALSRSAGRLLGRDADFQEAFAAVGRAISGEGDVAESLEEAYTAVFAPAEPEEGTEDTAEGASPSYTGARAVLALTDPLVQYVDAPFPASGTEERIQLKTEAEPEEIAQTLSVVSSQPAPPENASFELRQLGFAYATPLSGTLSSAFGWRQHPIAGEERFHYGIDIAADEGAAICAFADGTVYATGESSTLGNYIMLEHAGGYITLYAHCSRVTVTGGSVKLGDKIAEVGQTGAATGPHLHFELHDGSLYLNPVYYVALG